MHMAWEFRPRDLLLGACWQTVCLHYVRGGAVFRQRARHLWLYPLPCLALRLSWLLGDPEPAAQPPAGAPPPELEGGASGLQLVYRLAARGQGPEVLP